MSKYTTEVRFICETKSGLTESTGCSDVDSVIAKSWDKIFTTKVPFFDEEYRRILCSKILKHYYLREICSETIGIWLMWMNTRLEEIMPYYNQLYESLKLKFDPLTDTNVTREHTRTGKEESNEEIETNSNSTSKGESTANSNNNSKELYSDTPQGSITNLENNTYLTNATIKSDTANTTGDTTSTINALNTESKSNAINTTEDYVEKISGKNGTEDYSSLLLKYRKTFLNIDMQVIEEFEDMFIQLW